MLLKVGQVLLVESDHLRHVGPVVLVVIEVLEPLGGRLSLPG